MTPADISVVIPALNEEASVGAAVRSAMRCGSTDVIVVDGGSEDRTTAVATEAGVHKLVRSLPGRGIQLNSGAQLAQRDVLLFLHADSELSPDCLEQICAAGEFTWGAFRQRIDSSRAALRAIERGNALRIRLRGMAFGDQAIFVRGEVFRKHGGFAEIPLMEDVEFSRRFRRIAKPVLLRGPVTTSARRWEQQGVVRQTLRNWSLQLSYRLGARPEQLQRRYR